MQPAVLPKRKNLRLKCYDYSSCGAYFLTICTSGKENLFWTTVGANCVRPSEPLPLSTMGKAVAAELEKLSSVYPDVQLDQYCVMPNHVHMILTINLPVDGRTQFAPTVSRVVKQFKGAVSKRCGRAVWQRSFYDHVIRNQESYEEISAYIYNNPYNWHADKLFVP